jgi:hypothetical protein
MSENGRVVAGSWKEHGRGTVRCVNWPLTRQGNGMACVNWPLTRHGLCEITFNTAGERHCICELAFNPLTP